MGRNRGQRGKAGDVRVAEADTGSAATTAVPSTDRVTAVRDAVGNRSFGAMLAERRAANHVTIVKITAFAKSRESAQAILSDGSVTALPLSRNDLPEGEYRFERDESADTHYRQVEEEGKAVAPFLWLPKSIIGDSDARAEIVELTVLAGTPSTLRADLESLDPAILRALTSDETSSKPVSYADIQSVVVAGNMLKEYGVTEDELELLEYRAESQQRDYGRAPAAAGDVVDWALSYVHNRQAAGEAALANRTKLVAARQEIDALPWELARAIRSMSARNIDATWGHIRLLLASRNISLDDVIAAFDTELRSVATSFLSQGQLALHRIEKMYLARRNVGVERERLRTAMEAVRPALFQQQAGRHEFVRQMAELVLGEGSPKKVAEWNEEVAKREQNLKEESEAARLPVVGWKGFDPDLILDRDVDALLSGLQDFVYDARTRLHRAERMSGDITNLYKADKMVALAKSGIGIQPGSLLGDIISYRIKRETDDGFWSTLWDIVTFALMFVPGNIGIALRVGAGLVNMSKEAEVYVDAKTRSMTGMSSEDPSSAGFYLAAGGTFIDAGQMAKGVFSVAGREAGAASASRSIMRGEAPPSVPDVPVSMAPPPPGPGDELVWVNTGRGPGRGRYHPEGTPYFQKTREGVTMPRWQADDLGFVQAGTPRNLPVDPITPRIVNGRQVESMGANAGKPPKFISVTARAESAVNRTSIPPDLNESLAYNHFLDKGEMGLQRPLGANAPGVDAITAEIERDLAGRPVRAKLFVTDMTTPSAWKGLDVDATWLQEVDEAVAAGRLDFGDPGLEEVIRQAARDNVYVRIARVDRSATMDKVVTVNPNEVRKIR